jgi:hypothetical protein
LHRDGDFRLSHKLPPLPEKSHGLARTLPDMRICAVCGQRYNLRDLLQADHHTDEPHAPSSVAEARS